jgi:hypothetical protein
MTRNAFGLTTPFNYEADVILWLDEFTVLNSLISEILSEIQQASDEIIIADYDPEKNFGLSIEDRLVRLNSEIDNEELIELS